MTLRGTVAAVAAMLAGLCCGCAEEVKPDPTITELRKAGDEIDRLKKDNERLAARLAERDKQVESLLALGDKRLQKLYVVRRIRLGSGTGGADLDDKPGHDGVKVFVQPVDQHGSVIKAPGTVTIQLYDLAADPNGNLVARERFDLDATAGHWSSGFLAYHYSFVCRWKTPPAHNELTVRVAFLDYLTGKKHTAQQVCKIHHVRQMTTGPAK